MARKIRTIETLHINGGVLCLNFINTTSSRPAYEHDYLGSYSDLVGWGEKIGLYTTKQSRQFLRQFRQESQKVDRAFRRVKVFRELLYRVFDSLLKQTDPQKRDMEALLQSYGGAIAKGYFVKMNDSHELDWDLAQSYEAILWPVAYSAGQLLLSSDLRRVKTCGRCGWLFLDTSKNQSRRWCSMDLCGVRTKMRRYYQKSKKRSNMKGVK